MDVQQLNSDLAALLDKKAELNKISYSDKKYDELEEEVHGMEDELLEKYGKYLEEVIYNVHDEFCPDSDVLLPIAYLPKKLTKNGDSYQIDFSQGVFVAADDFEEKDTKLVLLANPLRLILQVNPQRQEILWQP